MNFPPLKVVMEPLAPTKGINVDGTLLAWQVSHAIEFETGTCLGLKLEMLFGVTPSKVPAVTLIPWQLEHPVVTPEWLYAELLNLAASCTGKLKLLVTPGALTWQLSHPKEPVGIWLLEVVLIAGLILGMAYLAAFTVL